MDIFSLKTIFFTSCLTRGCVLDHPLPHMEHFVKSFWYIKTPYQGTH